MALSVHLVCTGRVRVYIGLPYLKFSDNSSLGGTPLISVTSVAFTYSMIVALLSTLGAPQINTSASACASILLTV